MRELNGQHLYRVISDLSSKGTRNFSVTKIGRDYDGDNFFVEHYLDGLKWCLEKRMNIESTGCL